MFGGFCARIAGQDGRTSQRLVAEHLPAAGVEEICDLIIDRHRHGGFFAPQRKATTAGESLAQARRGISVQSNFHRPRRFLHPKKSPRDQKNSVNSTVTGCEKKSHGRLSVGRDSRSAERVKRSPNGAQGREHK